MISVEWHDNQTCENCKRENRPHCARITFDFEETAENVPDFAPLLCSDCVEDLKRRLS